MLNAIVRFSLRFRGIVIALACALLGYGIFSLLSSSYDAFPDFAPPEVSVQTEAPGLSPEQVEVLVTQPIENSINGATGIGSLRSRSIQGLSDITVVFRSGTDIYRDRQLVAERLSAVANELPTGVQPPLMTPLTSSTAWVMEVDFTSDKQSLMDLRTIADWTIKPHILAVPGVAGVEVNGGDVRQLQFQFDPQKLMQYGVSVEDVIAAARQSTGVRGGGFIETANQRIVLQTEAPSATPAQLAGTVLVHHNGANVTLGDVARVQEAPAPRIGAASVAGKRGVSMIVDAAYGANTLDVTRRHRQSAGRAETRPGSTGHRHSSRCIAGGRFHHRRAAQCSRFLADRRDPRRRGSLFIPLQSTHGSHFLHRYSSVSVGGSYRAQQDGPQPEYNDPRRPFHCDRRSRRRCCDRRREHLSSAPRKSLRAESSLALSGRI